MNIQPTPESILQQIAQIRHMERGTISVIRQEPQGPYCNHQRYEDDRNVSRYVPAQQVLEVQAAIADYRRFQELVDRYARLVVERTRAEWCR